MSEKEQTATGVQAQPEEEFPWQNGMVAGIVGKRIGINGLLDLRGVPAEQVAGIEELRINGVVLMDEGNRGALAGVKSEINGSVIVPPPGMRVIVQPDIELSKASLEAMPPGQKLMLVGNVFIKPEVPPALVAEKFEDLRLVGIVVMGQGVQGALLGKSEMTGVSIIVPDGVSEVVRAMGDTKWSADYLERLPDGIAYINVGRTCIPAGVPGELIERKIASYHNVGVTVAPEPILNLLKARCGTSMGQFLEPGEEGEPE
jgi:hypothetical protein